MSGRFLVFGDIHGEWEKFRSLLRQVQPDFDTDEVVFLGDYIDRGPAPKKVLDFMMTLPKCETIHLLRGNHEQMMLDAFRDFWNQSPSQWDMQLWLENGGDVTFRQIATSAEEFRRYAEFCKKTELSFSAEIDGRLYRFSHAGFYYDASWDLATPEDFLWDRSLADAVRDHRPIRYRDGVDFVDMTVVVGHTMTPIIREGCYEPIVTKEVIFMDTGSYMPDGRISCIDLRSGQVWQS